MLFFLASIFNLIFAKPDAIITLSCFDITAISPMMPSLEKIISPLFTLLFVSSTTDGETK